MDIELSKIEFLCGDDEYFFRFINFVNTYQSMLENFNK